MKIIDAFVDESGNHDLDTEKSGASTHFIVVAIVVERDKTDALYVEVEQLRKSHFQTGEIKSSSVKDKKDHKRRIRILNDILSLDFNFYILAIDKASIDKDSGLQYKKSFIKHINGKLYSRLYGNYSDVSVVADEHGRSAFKSSFKAYVEKNHKPDLFYKSKFSQVNSHENVLVQLADFVVGTAAKIYEEKKTPALEEKYIELLKSKALAVDEWPTKYQTYYQPDITTPEFDKFIFQHALLKAEVFIEKYESTADEDRVMQLCVLRRLVFHSRWGDKAGYLAASELIDHLKNSGFDKANPQILRSRIIAKLRDQDVIVASCNKGYKIPCCFADLQDFVERVNSVVVPYLSRLKKARNSYREGSNGEVDLLKGIKYPILVKLLEQIEE